MAFGSSCVCPSSFAASESRPGQLEGVVLLVGREAAVDVAVGRGVAGRDRLATLHADGTRPDPGLSSPPGVAFGGMLGMWGMCFTRPSICIPIGRTVSRA